MSYNRFHITLILYCLLIFAAAFLCFFFLYTRQQPNTAMGMALLAVLILLRMIHFVNRSNRILSNFLVYLQEKDPSLSYTVRYADKNFRGLKNSLEKLIREFRENRMELEVQSQYLEAILKNISTGILCFDDAGRIFTMNKAAENLLGTGSINRLGELKKVDPNLEEKMRQLHPDQELTEQFQAGGGRKHLSITCSRIKQGTSLINIITLKDISMQMEEQEITSWKKLIRVINHEVMNSMTPIITLSTAIRNKLTRIKTPEALEDAVNSAGIIGERSAGLIGFIERYKKLTGLPSPNREYFSAGELLFSIEELYRESTSNLHVDLSCQSDCDIQVEADREMMEQVLINLVQNAMDAVADSPQPEIVLSCFTESGGQVCISVRDNGEGIPADRLEQVFVPFFSTRNTGSGIGLSLCKQIMRLHHGQIQLDSEPGEGTCVTLRL
jgi:nitrogen fixation/metabolism regulation signal transduction histidine kinase